MTLNRVDRVQIKTTSETTLVAGELRRNQSLPLPPDCSRSWRGATSGFSDDGVDDALHLVLGVLLTVDSERHNMLELGLQT